MSASRAASADPDAVFAGLDADAARALAERFGTPIYLISEPALRARYRAIAAAARRQSAGARVAWSVKTNPLRAVLDVLRAEGAWAEVVSDFEWDLVRRCGVPGPEIVVNGPARGDAALRAALGAGALVHVDHLGEIERLAAIARDLGLARPAPIGLRLDLEGGRRFGLSPARRELDTALARLARAPELELAGLHAHLGTHIRDLARFRRASERLAEIARGLGRPLRWLDVGGGLAGTLARGDEPARRHAWPDPEAWCEAVLAPLAGLAPLLVLEPGRTLIEPAGALLARVVGERTTPEGGPAVVLDAGINALPTAPRHRHPVRALAARDGAPRSTTVYGPLCMQKDRLAADAPLPPLARGDLVLVEGAGAYDLPRATAFSGPPPGAVLWRGGGDAAWARRPETLDEVLARENPPPGPRSG